MIWIALGTTTFSTTTTVMLMTEVLAARQMATDGRYASTHQVHLDAQ